MQARPTADFPFVEIFCFCSCARYVITDKGMEFMNARARGLLATCPGIRQGFTKTDSALTHGSSESYNGVLTSVSAKILAGDEERRPDSIYRAPYAQRRAVN